MALFRQDSTSRRIRRVGQTARRSVAPGVRASGRLVGAAVLATAALAAANYAAARWAEHRHPPDGSFIEVDGVRLHYRDRGQGSPVVLIHGNVVSGDDFDSSGLTEMLLRSHRVIIFDRPGFGYSQRPAGRLWTAARQAELIHHALQQLGVGRAVIAGHSWGTLVALEVAARHAADVAGLVLISGYYFTSLRADLLVVGPAAIPVLGALLRYTVSPLFGWLSMPLFKRAVFAPAPVTQRFNSNFSPSMALRPWQLRATSVDGVTMAAAAMALRDRYRQIAVPVVILAGAGDQVVRRTGAERLQASIPGSTLQIIPGAGHMLHHVVPGTVADAIESVAARSSNGQQSIGNRETV